MIASTGILLMAAGLSRRYRLQSGQHKLQANPADGNPLPLLERNLQLATAVAGRQVNVVLRPEEQEMIALARRYDCAVTLLASPGLGSSIAAGVANRPWWTGWLVMLADMPWLQQHTVMRVFQALQFADTVRPVWRQQPGHPVGFSRVLRQSLLALKGDEGANGILDRCPPLQIEVNDPGCVWDIDVPADWQREQ
ncbi:NTP transferase domain-containing protein [Erwinia sp. JUb26]|uniref:nucleotidyltransferase family protein n=1 Tax=Erwinia sp. JUb26 TaxID=2485126 RepID=UPI000F49260C|nr:nucleotidyltransferase family protein [Erwinia sp. JUb26]ROR07894.1 molybdenum cofactor cytidylyltransferase [Erwinia sp. JUb26]